MRNKTIAEQLNGQRVDSLPIPMDTTYDASTGIHTFSDGSTAKILTKSEKCEPYIAASTTTMSTRPVKYWMAV